MRRIVIFGVAFAVVSVLATSAFANTRLRAHPELFDPGASGAPSAAWTPGTGLPDAGRSDHGLNLGMSANVAFPPGASADATVTKVGGLVLTSLSFDHKLGTQCGGGAPRWNLEFTDGSVYGIPCNEGTHSPVVGFPAWEHIAFSCADPSAAAPLSGPGGCAFGKTLTFAQVGFDFCITCPGSTTLDNLELNDCVMGKPGNC